jgi:hypothetical protein
MATDSASTTRTESSTASQDIGLPVPLPTESPIRDVVKDVVKPEGGSGGSGDEEEPAQESPPPQKDEDTKEKKAGKARKDKASTGSTSSPVGGAVFGGWHRFFGMGEHMFGPPSGFGYYTETQTVTAPGASIGTSAPAVRIAPVAITVPQNPAYLWVLLPLGFLLVVASAYAVFEPVRGPGRLALLVSSTRHSARKVPAGMTRTAARGVVRVVRVFGGWAKR